MRVRALLLNPTNQFIVYRLTPKSDPTNDDPEYAQQFTYEMVLAPYSTAINNSTEFERGKHIIQFSNWFF